MSFFTFNGINSKDLGLIVTKPVVRPSWAMVKKEIEAPGRSVNVMQFSKTYSNAAMTIDTVIADASPENVRSIYDALRGYGKLQISTAPDEYINAYVEPLVPEAVALLMAELPIKFTCEPFAYAVEPTVVQLTAGQTIITNGGTVYCAPEFTILAEGESVTLTVNGKEFVITLPSEAVNKVITVDCDAEMTYYNDSQANMISINQYTYNDYPLFRTGLNLVVLTGTIHTAYVTIRERWF